MPSFGAHACVVPSKPELPLIGENRVSHGDRVGLGEQHKSVCDRKSGRVAYTMQLTRQMHLPRKIHSETVIMDVIDVTNSLLRPPLYKLHLYKTVHVSSTGCV